jgi:hypothetical protein
MYGGQQECYLKNVAEIVSTTSAKISHAVAFNSDLSALFREILGELGAERNRIAREHGTKDAEHFGVYRHGETYIGSNFTTHLTGCYSEYNQKLLILMQKHLSGMAHTLREFQQTDFCKKENKTLNRNSSLDIKLLTTDTLSEWAFMPTINEFKRLAALCSVKISEDEFSQQIFETFLTNERAMRDLKAKSPLDYRNLKIITAIQIARERSPEWKKSDWVLATRRLEVNGKMYALSQYFTWIYRDFVEDPIQHMTGKSVITIIHQDPFLIDDMISDIGKIFKRIIEWNKGSKETLQSDMALFRYTLDHTAPFQRGSAAVTEWLEASLYRYHGLHLSYTPGRMVNLEALCLPFPQFVAEYPSMIELHSL